MFSDKLHKTVNRYLLTGEEVIHRELELSGKIIIDDGEYFLLSELGQRVGRGYSLEDLIYNVGEFKD